MQDLCLLEPYGIVFKKKVFSTAHEVKPIKMVPALQAGEVVFLGVEVAHVVLPWNHGRTSPPALFAYSLTSFTNNSIMKVLRSALFCMCSSAPFT